MTPSLIIFAKFPQPGRVKTRLARRVGSERAAILYKNMVETVLEQTRPENGEYQRLLCFDPPHREQDFRDWLPSLETFVPQYGRNLGERMQHAMTPLALSAPPVVLIGTDCTELNRDLICEAIQKLSTHDLVLGPAKDGGYYLIACKKVYPELFTGIAWSTEQVLAETLKRAESICLRVALLPILADIDD